MSAEDYRKRFADRPQKARDEQLAREVSNRNAQLNYQSEESKRIAEFGNAKAMEINRQSLLLNKIFLATSVGDRIRGIASILSGGSLVEAIAVEDKSELHPVRIKISTTKTIRIPYNTFVGKEIIRDESLSSFTPGGRHGVARVSYGQKLSEPKQLSDSLVAKIVIPDPYPTNGPESLFRLMLKHEYWVNEEMYWTKAWFEKTGKELRSGYDSDFLLDIRDGKVHSDSYSDIERTLDLSFDSLFDSYLRTTGQIK